MWKCPECGSKDLRVSVSVIAHLYQEDDGNFQTEVAGDHEWGEHSTMVCNACGHIHDASQFECAEDATKINYEQHFFTLLNDWFGLRQAHQVVRTEFEEVCDDLATARAELEEARARIEAFESYIERDKDGDGFICKDAMDLLFPCETEGD